MNILSGLPIKARSAFSGKYSHALFLAAFLALPGGAAAADGQPPARTETRSFSLSLDGSLDNYGESRTDSLRAGTEMDFASELKMGGSSFDWKLEAYYSYSRNGSPGYVSRADSVGLDLARIQLARFGEKELETVRPYLLAGLEYSWMEETSEDDDGTTVSSTRFLAPVAGAGLELKLNSRAALNLEYRSNLAGGARRISGLTLGVSYAIIGAEEEGGEEEAKTDEGAAEPAHEN